MRTTRRYRTVKIKAGNQTLTAADPLPDDLRDVLLKIRAGGVHKFEPSRVTSRQQRMD